MHCPSTVRSALLQCAAEPACCLRHFPFILVLQGNLKQVVQAFEEDQVLFGALDQRGAELDFQAERIGLLALQVLYPRAEHTKRFERTEIEHRQPDSQFQFAWQPLQ